MTDDLNDLALFAYTKDMAYEGPIANPSTLTATLRNNATGAVTLALAADDDMVDVLRQPGARVVGRLRGVGEFSGKVTKRSGKLRGTADTTFTIETDYRLLDSLAWVAPANPIAPTSLTGTGGARTAQAIYPGGGSDAGADGTTTNQYGYTFWPNGSAAAGGVVVPTAESAVKWLLKTNLLDRLNLQNVVIAPDQGRGGDPTAYLPQLRFSTLAEGVQPILDASGLSLVVLQQPGSSQITIDVRANSQWIAPLTVSSGIIDDGDWSTVDPTVTRGVLGGPGEDVARAFFVFADATGMEAEYGDVREVFRDSTGATLTWPDSLADAYRIAKYYLLRSEVADADKAQFRAYMASESNTALAAGPAKTSVSAKMNETDAFHYGGADGITLGTWVTVKAADGAEYTDAIAEVDLSYTQANGLQVTPVLGQRTDDTTRQLAEAIGTLAAAQRRLSTSR